MERSEFLHDEESPEGIFRSSLKHPYGELAGRGKPIPEKAIVAVKSMDEDVRRRHHDHMMSAHHKFMANLYRKQSHKK